MRHLLICILMLCGMLFAHAQNYSITSEGVDNNGNYIVRIVVSTKKNPAKSAEDLVCRYAVHGVMFKGIAAAKDYSGCPALIKDPNVEQTQKAWLDAFWNEAAYKKYANITPSSMSVMKNKQTKLTETSALVTVAHKELKAYLEKDGIISGLSNLW